MNDETIPRDLASITTKNIGLAGQMLREILDNPEILEEIPDNATVVPIPPDDPDLAGHNFGLAASESEAGKEVVLYRVGVPDPLVPAWRGQEVRAIKLHHIKPRWPKALVPKPGDLVVVFDRGRDVLMVDFFGLHRDGMGFPLGRDLALRVDTDAEEIVGYLVGGFLARIVLRAPHLTSLLRIAEFRELTIEELGGLEPPAVGGPGPDTEREAAEALTNEFTRLIA